MLNKLDDLLEHDKILIAARINTFEFIYNYHFHDQEKVQSLWQRRNKYQAKLNINFENPSNILDRNIFKDLINGLSVILINGFERKTFEVNYIKESDKFKVLDNKYGLGFAVHLFDQANKHFEDIKFA